MYKAAEKVMHSLGLPYRHPVTGVVTQSPKKSKKKTKKKSRGGSAIHDHRKK